MLDGNQRNAVGQGESPQSSKATLRNIEGSFEGLVDMMRLPRGKQ
jgi:hypothetical protein